MNQKTENAARVRYVILAMLFGFSFVSYLERINISIASELMMPVLSLTKIQMGHIFSGFPIGYAVFQVPTGILGDTIGPRRTLASAALLWGIVTVLTGFIPGLLVTGTTGAFVSLWILRFLLGSAEAATYPVGSRAVRNWMPISQRAFGNSVMFIGSSGASALAGPVISLLMVKFGWRESFYLSSILAFVIAILWYWYATDYPEQHNSVSHEELQQIDVSSRLESRDQSSAPMWTLLSDRKILFLSLSYVSEGYVLFIFLAVYLPGRRARFQHVERWRDRKPAMADGRSSCTDGRYRLRPSFRPKQSFIRHSRGNHARVRRLWHSLVCGSRCRQQNIGRRCTLRQRGGALFR
ncbi:MAG TPA: MFS transporter [Terriglobales bacterium]|nr:MFS transporter [Terriglobales bacterium]